MRSWCSSDYGTAGIGIRCGKRYLQPRVPAHSPPWCLGQPGKDFLDSRFQLILAFLLVRTATFRLDVPESVARRAATDLRSIFTGQERWTSLPGSTDRKYCSSPSRNE